MADRHPYRSPNFDDRPSATPVDMLVFHYTGMRDAASALDRLCDPYAKVSAHYVIDEDGAVYALVDDDKRAWHAGVSAWRGHRDVNARSIGIELTNPGHEFGYRAFPESQMAALETLSHDLLRRHPIPPRNVVGHSDVAPARKQDPGELFDWHRFADAGIGLWIPAIPHTDRREEEEKTANLEPSVLLENYGYDIEDLPAAVTAFQRHFRPEKIDGSADAETVALLARLNEEL
ncbi:MAG: N-acetylmuramoyl-L-alanine amidase [Proteobacteria bacterium]|nr:N-acetylmuramoyl-L-alanine amidase [Pseudomonadota bacterium]